MATKPGGKIVYSTCTLNREENEEIIEWALQELPLKMEKIELNIKNATPAISENKEAQNAIKILPSKETEGFFVAKLSPLE